MPGVPTYDQLEGVSYDILFTYDDPLQNHRLNQAYALQTVTRNGPSVAVDWSGSGEVIDGLDAPFAKEDFDHPYTEVIDDPFDRSVSNGLGVEPVSGNTYQLFGGAASDYNVAAGVATISMNSTAERRAFVDAEMVDQEFSGEFVLPVVPTGAPIRVRAAVRATDGSNYYFAQLEVATDAIGRLSIQKVVGGSITSLVSGVVVANHAAGDRWGITVTVRGPLLYASARNITSGSAAATRSGGDAAMSLNTGTLTGMTNLLVTGNTNTTPVVVSWDNVRVMGSPGGWPTSKFGDVWATSGTQLTHDGSTGLIAAAAVNTLYTALLNGLVYNDYDYMVRVKLPTLMTGAKGSVYLFARRQDANNYWRYRFDFNTDQILGWGIEAVESGSPGLVAAGLVPIPIHSITQQYNVRVQGYGKYIRIKVWREGTPQPDDWLIEHVTDTTFNGKPGSIGIGFQLDSGNSNTLPVALEVSLFWSGLNMILDNGQVSSSKTLDDGLPDGATDRSNIGVGEAIAELSAPVGTRSSVYWSTFRTDQPFSDVERDVAGVAISSGAVASDGIRDTRLFTGQMADIVVENENVTLKAVSKNRLKLSTLVQAPAVHGFYEGGEATWHIGYALFKSGLYVAPPPIEGCRLYLPLRGTLHAWIPAVSFIFSAGTVVYPSVGVFAYGPTSFVDGPFPGTCGTNSQINAEGVSRPESIAANSRMAPGDDFWSKTASRGRIEYWVRGDATDVAGSNDPTASVIARVLAFNPGVTNFLQCGIAATTRQLHLSLSDGVSSHVVRHSKPLPVDGQWHFIGGAWDLPAGELALNIDGITETFSSSPLSITNLPNTDDIQPFVISAAIPMSEVRVTSGRMATHRAAPWVRDIPWSADVKMRRSILTGPGFAQKTPREAYEIIQEYAQGDLARTGFDEHDVFQYLPPSYFAESTQQLEVEALSTDDSLGRDFQPARPVNKIYNQVVVRYKRREMQEVHVKLYENSSIVTLLGKKTTVLDIPFTKGAVEVRASASPFSILSGSALEAAPPTDTNAFNYITANTVPEGTGTYATSSDLVATITDWNPGGATVSIRNNSASTFYITNNVNLPSMGMGGKAITEEDASVVAENSASILVRGPRTLDAPLPAISRADEASLIANELAARLGFPRATFTSSVFGDPRRSPGQLVSVSDPDKTNLEGNFRITGVRSTQEREDLQQQISGEEAWPVLVWGVGKWGEAVWGEA